MPSSKLTTSLKEFSPSALIGSSLGGFYATYFSEHYNLKCVGINPAVIPPAEMSEYLGENKNYSTGKKFFIAPGTVRSIRPNGERD